MRFLAPAKLNLFLHVVGRRVDGYHLLQSAMTLIDLFDVLDIEPTADGRIVLTTPAPGVPPEQDLTYRAALLLQQAAGQAQQGCRIQLTKHIPMGGGLGGGSSDAATVLMALNHLWNLSFSAVALQGLGVKLGADVPFFLGGGSAWVEGIGERLSPITLPNDQSLVARPPLHVPTATIFGSPYLTRDHKNAKMEDFSAVVATPGWREFASANGTGFCNDLQTVAARAYPLIAELVSALNVVSAPSTARMTGSGSCVFVPFEAKSTAERAAEAFRAALQTESGRSLLGTRVFLAQGLPQHPHANLLVRG